MKDLRADRSGLVGEIILVIITIVAVLLLLVLYNDVQHIISVIEHWFQSSGSVLEGLFHAQT